MRKRAAMLIIATAFLAACGGYVVRKIEGPRPLPADKSESTATEEEGNPLVVKHIVGKGETLRSIARDELGSELLWRNLMEWNKLNESEQPAPGKEIEVPVAFRGMLGGHMASATVLAGSRPKTPPAPPRFPAHSPAKVLPMGERLVYDVKWFALKAGQANMNIVERKIIDGTDCFHFLAQAKSGLIFFFKVDDRIESYSTASDLLPVRFEKHLSEGKYRKDKVVTFDRVKMVSRSGDAVEPLGQNCRDLLGSFFYYRTMPLPGLGKETPLCINSDGKNYEVFTEVLRRERVKVPAGEFNTVLIKPKMKFEGLWRQKGDILIWLTDDARRIPVLVSSKVFLLGSVDIVLVKMEQYKNAK